MKIYVVDFETILKNFKPYHESLDKIQSEKKKFSDDVEMIKKEMESIINSSRSLLLDDSTQMANANRFKELQTKAIKLESDFRSHITQLQNQELEIHFEEVSAIVDFWARKTEVDIVINKSSTIYTSEKVDATEAIMEILKDKNLYQEWIEEQIKEEEETPVQPKLIQI